MSEASYDIIVIGAGISGLAFASFYLDVHPDCPLLILEEELCVGGVWSATRLYDEFWTQSGQRMVGFSDVPFTLPSEATSYYGTFEAKHLNRYLEDYLDSHVYNGTSLRSRIGFGKWVEKVQKTENTWITSTRTRYDGEQRFRSKKLVVAAGLTSLPNLPSLPNLSDFKGPVRHHRRFGEFSKSLQFNSTECQDIAVLGAGKSATDMVYESVKKGKCVSWIIRKSGEGPALFFPAPGKGRYQNSTEQGATRWSQLFSPSSYMPVSWIGRLIHRTDIGRNYITSNLQQGDQMCHDAAAYRNREGALPCFQHLECSTKSFWCTGPLGLVQHDDFWDVIAKNVRVYRNEISSMGSHSIILDDGLELSIDALLCGTGWKTHYPFFSAEQTCRLGLPHPPSEDSIEEKEHWAALLELADLRVVSEFPMLKDPPPYKQSETLTTTARLYNCIAPLEDHSVVFLGRAHLSNSFRTAEAQAIWATAYFDDNIIIPPVEKAKEEIAYMNAFSRRRYPSHGGSGDYLFFELLWYTDKLLKDVGLASHRKGWRADLVDPCLASDMEGTRDEYKQKTEKRPPKIS